MIFIASMFYKLGAFYLLPFMLSDRNQKHFDNVTTEDINGYNHTFLELCIPCRTPTFYLCPCSY